jgi:hypothetical protein
MRIFTLAILFSIGLVCFGDELHLRDGTVLKGKLRAAGENVVTFETEGGVLITKTRAEVRAIVFGDTPPPSSGPATLPPKVAEGLKATRWTTFRRFSRFTDKDVGLIYAVQMSANAEKVIFCGYSGTYTMNTDGTGLVQISKRANDGYIGISADGKKIAWSDDKFQIAKSDGTGAIQPIDFYIHTLRMTAGGDRVLVRNADGDLFWVSSDGKSVKKIAAVEDIARFGGRNETKWNSGDTGMSISADGSKIVFRFGQNAFAMNGDGTNIRRLTDFAPEDDLLNRVRISADGSRIAFLRVPNIEKAKLTILNWDGSEKAVFEGRRVWKWGANGRQVALSPDGNTVVLSPGIRFFSADGKTSWDADEWGNDGDSDSNPIFGLDSLSFSSDFKRGVGLAAGRQLVFFEFNPSHHGPSPLLSNMDVKPRAVTAEAPTPVVVSAEVQGFTNQVFVVPMREGWRVEALGLHGNRLKFDGAVYRTENLRVDTKDSGPMTLRFAAFNADGHGMLIDVEGFETR